MTVLLIFIYLAITLIVPVTDADGNTTTYTYALAPLTTGAVFAFPKALVLSAVTAPDGSATQYTYSSYQSLDHTPVIAAGGSVSAPATWTDLDLASVTDPNHQTYTFTYVPDLSKFNYAVSDAFPGFYYLEGGLPRNIKTVTMPDGTQSSFVNKSNERLTPSLFFEGNRENDVTDATGFQRSYKFSNAGVVPIPVVEPLAITLTSDNLVLFTTLTITEGALGSETYTFDPNASMALSQTIDFSGNVTKFAHTDAWKAPRDYAAVLSKLSGPAVFNGVYDDPTSQTDAMQQTKSFTYYSNYRIMQSVTDENGNKTYYDIDALGRRTSEKLYDSLGNLFQETDFTYGNATYPGFVTQTVRKSLGVIGGHTDPGWVTDLTTVSVPDADGRVQKQIEDPNGLALTTSYTYDANGNKLTSTDPLGRTTTLTYDNRNRLTTTTFADTTTKQMFYDARGNLIKDTDENNHSDLYVYDKLNRVVQQARDMNNDGVIDSGDIVTSSTYNPVNSKVTTTSPLGGVTSMTYDGLQRVTKIVTTPDNSTYYSTYYSTTFDYGMNSGGTVFNMSGFKPTHTVDPRGFTSDVVYDALYRPISTASVYDQSKAPAMTYKQYDPVGNVLNSTDALGRVTHMTYDALDRPIVTTLPDNNTMSVAYTSTGFKYLAIDPNGNIAQTVYDTVGRQVMAIAPEVPDPNNGNTLTAPTTTTTYDSDGNVLTTKNALGQVDTFTYDVRNRKVTETEPAVTDASATPAVSSQPIMKWGYDFAGNVTTVTDARGNTSTSQYDPANRVTDIYQAAVLVNNQGNPVNPHSHTDYDADGNVVRMIDPDGNPTINTYDFLNRLLTSTDAASITVTNSYDEVGNLKSVMDGKGQTTQFTYDGFKRPVTTTDLANNVTTLVYDPINKTERIDSLGQPTFYYYDSRNWIDNVDYGGANSAINSPRNYNYDADGNLLSVIETDKSIANVGYTYDALNRTITEISGGLTHNYTYDLIGNRVKVLYGSVVTLMNKL